ncbi:divergent PAP2 family protein [bacterium AH-315-K03]|nr:divergent PAP2 family protein [bacterium AH-315-K03]
MSLNITYAIAPFVTWLITGITKFLINSIKSHRLAFDKIGYGGLPSNHSAIVSCTTALIALKEDLTSPAFGIAITLSFIVILDAHSLRRQIGLQAQAINQLKKTHFEPALRERIGHTHIEITAGILVGVLTAMGLHYF